MKFTNSEDGTVISSVNIYNNYGEKESNNNSNSTNDNINNSLATNSLSNGR